MVTSRIVVGIDGSQVSKEALLWAMDEAVHRGCLVEAVCAWQADSSSAVGAPPQFGLPYRMPQAIHDEHENLLDRVVSEVSTAAPHVVIRKILAQGWPPKVLADRSEDAALLVIGRHQHSLFSEKLLGSVSTYCIRNAHCPVVIIQAPSVPEYQQTTQEVEASFSLGPLL